MIRAFLVFLISCPAAASLAADQPPPRPNILWLTSEDNGPHLGCYGDEYANTPNLDRLAAGGLRYLNCWSNAPVCAPARTAIISGMYPPSLGAEHMRSEVPIPEFLRLYPQLLREAGYYCTNNSKEDYNVLPHGQVWDESSPRAHYKNRGEGQPFFAVFNHVQTHESQIRARPHKAVHDPAKVRLPAYHPDAPEVRQDWAQYYDNITQMDAAIGQRLQELEEAGLAEDTIVFYYGDHGSGMPRSKRCCYNSGLNVPLIVHIPNKFAHLRPAEYAAGGETDRLVSFVDLAPTLLGLLGQDSPVWMQGQAFLGSRAASPREYVFGFRGRMDERIDLVRSVRDKRYVYVRNFMPHRACGQHVSYMFETPTTRVWKKLFDAGQLKPPQTAFWQPKPVEELYDLRNDPDEVNNLANSPLHQDTLRRLRAAQQAWSLEIRDLGFLPEGEMHARSQGGTPYEMGHDDGKYPLRPIMTAADRATTPTTSLAVVLSGLRDRDPAVRYWAATGILMRGEPAVRESWLELVLALSDRSPYARIAIAEALGRYGDAEALAAALPVLLESANIQKHGLYEAVPALIALDELGDKVAEAQRDILSLPDKADGVPARMADYVERLKKKIVGDKPHSEEARNR